MTSHTKQDKVYPVKYSFGGSGPVSPIQLARNHRYGWPGMDRYIHPTTQTTEKLKIEDCYPLQLLQNLKGLSQSALLDLIKRNHIPKLKQGKFVYVPKAAIDQLLGPVVDQGSKNDTND